VCKWRAAAKNLLAGIAGIIAVCASQAASANPSGTMDAIRKAGSVKVGVKTDVAPFGFINPQGEVVGFEIDLAEEIAGKLGVNLVKVGVTTENRFQKLELGEVDLLMATIGDTPARRQIATGIEPGYFETGVSVLLAPNQAATRYEEIRGKTLCALQGAYFNRPMSDRYLLNLEVYRTVRDALLALKDGRCIGFLYISFAVKEYLKRPEWSGYKAPFGTALSTPMAIFVRRSEQGTEFEQLLGNMAADWQRTGNLLRTAKKWGVEDSGWMEQQRQLWSRERQAGRYFCERNDKGLWPQECRNAEILTSEDVDGLQAMGLRLREMTGVDLNFFYDPFSRSQVLGGILNTMLLCALAIAMSLALGVLASIVADSASPPIRRLLIVTMSLGRLNPPLLLMYLLFFGVGSWLFASHAMRLSAVAVAVFCLGFYSAGLVMNAFIEAANHMRISRPGYLLDFSTIPDALEFSSWPIMQSLINLTKQTMIASAIAIPELLSSVNLIMAEKGNIFATMTFLLVAFYFITDFWVRLFTWLEAKYRARSKPPNAA
jgi:polar amino acid transport system substrate-binding protein